MQVDGQLPVGILIDGVVYRAVTVRAATVGDTMHAGRDTPKGGFHAIATLARQTTLADLGRCLTYAELIGAAEEDGDYLFGLAEDCRKKRMASVGSTEGTTSPE